MKTQGKIQRKKQGNNLPCQQNKNTLFHGLRETIGQIARFYDTQAYNPPVYTIIIPKNE